MNEQKPVIPRDEYARLLSLAEDFYRQNRQDCKKALPEDLVSALVSQAADILAKTSRQERKARQAEGIAQAKRAGVRFGRPPAATPTRPDGATAHASGAGVGLGPPRAPTPTDFPALVQRWQSGEITFRQALAASGLSESTFYRRLRQNRQAQVTAPQGQNLLT